MIRFNPATDTYVEKSLLRRFWKRLRGHPVYIITKGFSQGANFDDVKFEGNVLVTGHNRREPQPRKRWWPSKRVVYRGPAVNDFGDQTYEGVMPDGTRWKIMGGGLGSIGFEFTSEKPE